MTYTVAQPASSSRWLWLGGVSAALGALTLLDGPVLCPFRRCTGGYCPLCGVTRSAAALVRFEPVTAIKLYPALPLVAVAAVLGLWPERLGRQRSDRTLVAIGLLILVIWAVRLVAGDIPRPTQLMWPVPIS